MAIVGRKNYQNITLVPGQNVFLQREPQNRNDPNAILVCTYDRRHVGHLSRKNAAILSKFMDYDTLIFGHITDTAHGFFKTSLIVDKIIESSRVGIFTN